MICACQMSATDSRPIRNTQSARARFVYDSAAGRRRVRTNQAIEKSPSTSSSAWRCSRCKSCGQNVDTGAILVPWPSHAAAIRSGSKNAHLACLTTKMRNVLARCERRKAMEFKQQSFLFVRSQPQNCDCSAHNRVLWVPAIDRSRAATCPIIEWPLQGWPPQKSSQNRLRNPLQERPQTAPLNLFVSGGAVLWRENFFTRL